MSRFLEESLRAVCEPLRMELLDTLVFEKVPNHAKPFEVNPLKMT